MKTVFVLDACALIAFLNDEPGADVVEELLKKASRNEVELVMNVVNTLEIYYNIFREDGIDMANQSLGKIENLPIEVVRVISASVFKEAGRLKATCRLSLADAIALAEANIRDVQIVTADHHEFDDLENKNMVKVYWIR